MNRHRRFVDPALQRAMDLFRQRGYEETSTRELCTATGVGPRQLHATFGGREGVYLATVEWHREHMAATAERTRSSDRHARLVIRDMLQQPFGDSDHSQCGPGCLLLRVVTERIAHPPRLDRLLRDVLGAVETTTAEIVREGQRKRELSPAQDPAVVAHFLVTTMQGLRLMALTDSEPSPGPRARRPPWPAPDDGTAAGPHIHESACHPGAMSTKRL